MPLGSNKGHFSPTILAGAVLSYPISLDQAQVANTLLHWVGPQLSLASTIWSKFARQCSDYKMGWGVHRLLCLADMA